MNDSQQHSAECDCPDCDRPTPRMLARIAEETASLAVGERGVSYCDPCGRRCAKSATTFHEARGFSMEMDTNACRKCEYSDSLCPACDGTGLQSENMLCPGCEGDGELRYR